MTSDTGSFRSSEPTRVRVLLVDDHPAVCEGLRLAFATTHDLRIVGEAISAQEASVLFRDVHADIGLIDLGLPDGDGLALVATLHDRYPLCPLVIFTGAPLGDVAALARTAGAAAVVSKRETIDTLMATIRRLVPGHPELGADAPSLSPRTNAMDPLRDLSAREREVFRLAVIGISNDSIGAHLRISVKTVETHRARINQKLNVHSPADLVRFAARHRLLDAEPATHRPAPAPAGLTVLSPELDVSARLTNSSVA